MMGEILRASVRLEVHEPWEKTEIILGKVVGILELHGRTFIQILPHRKSGVYYMVSERYIGELFEELKYGKKVHVAIYYSDTDLEVGIEVDFVDSFGPYRPYGRGSLIITQMA